MNRALVMKQLKRNAAILTTLHKVLEYSKQSKTMYDVEGFLEDEYKEHNFLKIVRKEIKDYADFQKALKALNKGK